MRKLLLFQGEYSSDSISDIERDVYEAFDPEFNSAAKELPFDFPGTIKITITYEENEDEARDSE